MCCFGYIWYMLSVAFLAFFTKDQYILPNTAFGQKVPSNHGTASHFVASNVFVCHLHLPFQVLIGYSKWQ